MHSPALSDSIGAHDAFPTSRREISSVHTDNASSRRILPSVGYRDGKNVPSDCGTKNDFQLSCQTIVSTESEQYEWTAQAILMIAGILPRYLYHGL